MWTSSSIYSECSMLRRLLCTSLPRLPLKPQSFSLTILNSSLTQNQKQKQKPLSSHTISLSAATNTNTADFPSTFFSVAAP